MNHTIKHLKNGDFEVQRNTRLPPDRLTNSLERHLLWKEYQVHAVKMAIERGKQSE